MVSPCGVRLAERCAEAMRAKRYAEGGHTLTVGGYMPPAPTSSGTVDRSQTTQEVLNDLQTSSTPAMRMRKGGYVKAADGIAKRGKTRGVYR